MQGKQKIASQESALRNLVRQLNRSHQDRESLQAKCKQLEGSLARAENRIAQLSILTRCKGAIVTPGVSKRVLVGLTEKNTKLKLALEHVTERKE